MDWSSTPPPVAPAPPRSAAPQAQARPRRRAEPQGPAPSLHYAHSAASPPDCTAVESLWRRRRRRCGRAAAAWGARGSVAAAGGPAAAQQAAHWRQEASPPVQGCSAAPGPAGRRPPRLSAVDIAIRAQRRSRPGHNPASRRPSIHAQPLRTANPCGPAPGVPASHTAVRSGPRPAGPLLGGISSPPSARQGRPGARRGPRARAQLAARRTARRRTPVLTQPAAWRPTGRRRRCAPSAPEDPSRLATQPPPRPPPRPPLRPLRRPRARAARPERALPHPPGGVAGGGERHRGPLLLPRHRVARLPQRRVHAQPRRAGQVGAAATAGRGARESRQGVAADWEKGWAAACAACEQSIQGFDPCCLRLPRSSVLPLPFAISKTGVLLGVITMVRSGGSGWARPRDEPRAAQQHGARLTTRRADAVVIRPARAPCRRPSWRGPTSPPAAC
jgi:hypothetical protein